MTKCGGNLECLLGIMRTDLDLKKDSTEHLEETEK